MVGKDAPGRTILGTKSPRPPLIAWVGNTARVGTHFRNVLEFAGDDPGIRTLALRLEPVRLDGFERYLGLLPSSAQEIWGTLPLYRRRDVDVVWSQRGVSILPWLLTARAWRRTPIVYSIDSTLKQLNDFGPLYGYFGGRTRARFAVRNRVERLLMHRMTLIAPWNDWVARSVRDDYGIPEERIRVLAPGVDLDFWRPAPPTVAPMLAPRGIFVGGDFERKAGDLLLDVFRRRFRGRVELDLVTRRPLPAEPGVRVHTGLAGKDPRLLALYQGADFLVLPTRADVFSMAALEAFACELPVILGRTGGAAELFEDGVQGYYVDPGDEAGLVDALEQLVSNRSLRRRMGQAGRVLAESRYDARRNAGLLTDLLQDLARRRPRP